MNRKCISNDVNQIMSCVYNNYFECSAHEEQFKYCYFLNYKTLTGYEAIYNDNEKI